MPVRGRVHRAVAALAALSLLAAPVLAQAQALIRDTEVEEILRKGADPLFAAAGLNPRDVDILLVGDKELNAFATTERIGEAEGPKIALYSGLILETETPNQLRGVIAHEACHVACGHVARQGQMMKAGLSPMLLTMGLGLLAAMAGAPDAAAGLVASGSYFGTLGVLAYSRVQESSADLAAAGYLEKTGQSGRGLVEFFDNFRYQEVFSEARRYGYFRSHPTASASALPQGRERRRATQTTVSGTPTTRHEGQARCPSSARPQQSFINTRNIPEYPARYAPRHRLLPRLRADRALRRSIPCSPSSRPTVPV